MLLSDYTVKESLCRFILKRTVYQLLYSLSCNIYTRDRNDEPDPRYINDYEKTPRVQTHGVLYLPEN